MAAKIHTNINSEFGKLEAVIIHQPGSEIENMTPVNAERALYSDILNLHIASYEYQQLKGVLEKVSAPFEVEALLADVLADSHLKENLLKQICYREDAGSAVNLLLTLEPATLAKSIIEGVFLEKDNLTKYLSQERYLLRPLHNLFFTRDASMAFNGQVLIARMASAVRERESLIMETIFRNHPLFETKTLNPATPAHGIQADSKATIEGGDFEVARHDVFIIGTGIRTSTQGIDFVIENLKSDKGKTYHIIVQELPPSPESFIHLDMVFTLLDYGYCMVYEPVIMEINRYKTIHITISGGKVASIKEEPNIPAALKKLGMDMKPVPCGGSNDSWKQEREQWHSGANFLAFAPGKLIGYERNINTLDELSKNGFDILPAESVISGTENPANSKRCVVTIEGSELARGGGGARCMTMPARRADIKW